MSIKDIGHLEFFGEQCIYIQDDMDYVITPVNENANIFCHSLDQDYKIQFTTPLSKKSMISVQKQIASNLNCIRLKLNYIAKCTSDESVTGFIMSGNEIDEFFSPLEYYFKLKRTGQYSPTDLLYGSEVIANYKFVLCGKDISIDLVYGNLLRDGIRADLTLHPNLIIKFDETEDFDFIKQVYDVIIVFLQFVHRKQSCNIKNIELFSKSMLKIGYMFSSLYNRDLRPQSRIDASFAYYGDKISNLFSLISSDPNVFPIKHLCDFNGNPFAYSFDRFAALCSAFEYEYRLNSDYPQESLLNFDEIKNDIVDYISNKPENSKQTIDFKNEAIKRIQELGCNPGLKQKIVNAYNANKNSLEKSLPLLLVRIKTIDEFAKMISKLRGKVLHNDSRYDFDDKETESIHFLEVLQFVMVLRRAKFTQNEIEMTIGVVFHCNSEYLKMLK